jgi:hypothetical protein
MFTSTFSAVLIVKSTFFVFVVVPISEGHRLSEEPVPGPLGDVLLLMDEAFVVSLFEKVKSGRCHSLSVERSGLLVVRAVGLIVGFEVGHFYCSQRFICNFLSLSILSIL